MDLMNSNLLPMTGIPSRRRLFGRVRAGHVWRYLAGVVIAILVLGVWLADTASAQSMRIKEIAAVQGVRSNQLTGYGLVVGLDGTGDQTTQMPYTAQSMGNYLQQLGLSLPPGASMQLKNVAAVLVTAELPAFARPGQSIDVTVSCAAAP
jgi:flagellar P-ring protein FlgI